MPDLFVLLRNWWKQILLVMLLSLIIIGVITWLKPRQYLATATAVPASAFAADKSTVFNENLQSLYTALGTPDDLDMILGTAKLDTAYLSVTDQFNLYDHYKVSEKGDAARIKSAYLLKKNTRVMKSEYGELKVKVWDTDRNLAPQLANAIMHELQRIHADLKNAGNLATLQGLKESLKKKTHAADSANTDPAANSPADFSAEEKAQYEKLINQYQLMLDSRTPALLVVENAKTPAWADRPRRMQTLVATALLSLLFSLLAALVLERRKIRES